jgi:exopolysaccharide production protein ExoZ
MARQLVMIQYLRAVSAVGIVLFHVSRRQGIDLTIGEGRIALFFIVSGFILWWITAGRTNDPAQFMLRRLARLVPLYWLVTLVMLAASRAGLTSHQPASTAQFITSILFIPHRNALGQIFPVLMPGWTLVYEMAFCIAFTALLCIEERRRVWAATGLLGGLTLWGIIFHPTAAIAETYTSQILLEFLAGLWLAHLWPHVRVSKAAAWALLGLGGGLSLLLEPLRMSPWPALVSGAPALMVVAGALALEPSAGGAIGWLKRIGDSSYSIYLWHIPAMIVSEGVARALHIKAPLVLIAWETSAGVVAGLLLYAILEKPLTEFLFALLNRRVRAPIAAPA